MDLNIKNTSLSDLREALDKKEIGAEELTQEYLSRIKRVDPQLKAFITVTEDIAVESARNAQKRIDKGESAPLTGIPVAVKDNICTDGVKTTCASKMLENFVPPYDAAVVERLKSQDYVMLGKTSMDEFAMGGSTQTSAFAKTKNPIDLDRIPGGSSGGSAAAVSAGIAPVALGSDTGGSIRQPASFCGVTGIKPTYGRVSRYGLVAFASSLDQIGPICRSAKDCGIMLNVISGRDRRDATSSDVPVPDFCEKIGKDIKGLRIAIPEEFYGEMVDSEISQSVTNAAKELEKHGAVLKSCSMPALKYAIPAYFLIACAEAASNLSRYDGIKYGLRGEGRSYGDMILDSRNKGFGREVKRRILLGNYALSSGYYDAYYRKACAVRQEIRAEYARIFEDADIIITPTAPTVARRIDEKEEKLSQTYMGDILTVTVNIAGLPAINTTCGVSSEGMPIGMSLVGKPFDEATLIQVADFYEQGFTPVYKDM